MKKLVLLLAVFLAATAFAFAGGGAQKSAATGAPPYIVDLSTLTIIPELNDKINPDAAFQGYKNKEPLQRRWRWFVATFKDLPDNITEYQRVCVKIKYYDADGNEMPGADSSAQVSMFYDLNADLHTDGNSNLAFKEMNVGGFSGLLDKDRGVRVRLKAPPAGIVLQAAQAEPKFIEIVAIVFHNGDYKSE
jgi:hypothetical protein